MLVVTKKIRLYLFLMQVSDALDAEGSGSLVAQANTSLPSLDGSTPPDHDRSCQDLPKVPSVGQCKLVQYGLPLVHTMLILRALP